MQRKTFIIAGALGLLVTVAGAVMYSAVSGSGGAADPGDPAQVALGKARYQEFCASCHGDNLQGQPNWRTRRPDDKLPAPPHDASGHTWHHSDRQLFEITKRGTAAFAPAGYQTDMAGFADTLSDEEIWAVLAYIKSTWPAAILERQEMANRHRQ